jgi:hypothetical protein
MPLADSDNFLNKFKHYSVNAAIVILAVLTVYLLYNFVKRQITPQAEIIKTQVDTANHLTKQPSGSTLQIDVQNGSGVAGIADKFTEFLRSKGFDVVEMGNFSSSDVKTSMVIDRAGNMRNAKRVALSVGINEKFVIQQMNKNYFLDATVVIGKDYAELLPMKTSEVK